MAVKTINKIKETEAQAEKLCHGAKLKANDIILKAQKDAGEILRVSSRKTDEIVNSKVLAAEDWACEYLKKSNEILEQEILNLRSIASGNMQMAVEFVIKNVLKQ